MYSGTTFYFVQKSFLVLVALEVHAVQNHVQLVLRVFYNEHFWCEAKWDKQSK